MACDTNLNYVAIINKYPTHFFRVGRGLPQGCSLSPLLFILAMDGLSLHINKAMVNDQFQALHMGNNIKISHGFFIDHVLIMCMLNRFAWLTLFHVFKFFSNTTGLHMSLEKSTIYHGLCDMEGIYYIKVLFGIEVELMTNGMKCLGYHIKP